MYTQPTYTRSRSLDRRTNPSLAVAVALAALPFAVLVALQFPGVTLGAFAGAIAARTVVALRRRLRARLRTVTPPQDRRPA